MHFHYICKFADAPSRTTTKRQSPALLTYSDPTIYLTVE